MRGLYCGSENLQAARAARGEWVYPRRGGNRSPRAGLRLAAPAAADFPQGLCPLWGGGRQRQPRQPCREGKGDWAAQRASRRENDRRAERAGLVSGMESDKRRERKRLGNASRWKAVRAGAGVFLFKRWPCAAQPGGGAMAAQRYDGGGAMRTPVARDGGGRWFAGLATRSPPPMRPNHQKSNHYNPAFLKVHHHGTVAQQSPRHQIR